MLLNQGYHFAKSYLSGGIIYLIFYITAKCNARCKMCFAYKGMKEREEKAELGGAEIEKLAKSFSHLAQVTLSGGEPLLREDIIDIIYSFYRWSGSRFFTIPTNCLMPETAEKRAEEFLLKCPYATLNFCLSINGIGKDHDAITQVPGNFERFEETYKRIRYIADKNPRISLTLNIVLSKYNQDKIYEIIDYLDQTYSDEFFGIALARGDTLEADAVDVSPEIYHQSFLYLREKFKSRKSIRKSPFPLIENSIYDFVHNSICKVMKGNKDVFRCLAGKRILVIYEEGTVAPCELIQYELARAGIASDGSMGNLRDFDFNIQALLNSDRAKEILKKIEEISCNCTWECAIVNSTFFQPLTFFKVLFLSARQFFFK